MLASLYYMSNYSTKDDIKLHQLVMTASIFKSALEKATAAKENLTPQQLSLLKTKPGDYAMKIYQPRPQSRDTGWDGFAQIAQYFHNILMLIPLTGRKLVQNG